MHVDAGMKSWGWQAHDGKTFGRQVLEDTGVRITTSWLKADRVNGWAARVRVEPKTVEINGEERTPAVGTIFLYLANEDGTPIEFEPNMVAMALGGGVPPTQTCSFSSVTKGNTWCAMVVPSDGPTEAGTRFSSAKTTDFHNLTDLVRQHIMFGMQQQYQNGIQKPSIMLPNSHVEEANVVFLQVTGKLPFSVDIPFLLENPSDVVGQEWKPNSISSSSLTAKLEQAEKTFDVEFDKKFGDLKGARDVAKAALSNMLGGIGYWYGHSLVKLDPDEPEDTVKLWDAALFSATPSRSFFPRGFLWDEGFHQVCEQCI